MSSINNGNASDSGTSSAVNASLIDKGVSFVTNLYQSPHVQKLKNTGIALYSGIYTCKDYCKIQNLNAQIANRVPNRRQRRLMKQLKSTKFDFVSNIISTLSYTTQVAFPGIAKEVYDGYVLTYHSLDLIKESSIQSSSLIKKISNVAVAILGVVSSGLNIAVFVGVKDPNDSITNTLNLIYTGAYYMKFACEKSGIL